MKTSELEFINSILQLLINYGIPATLNIIRTWDKKNPTIEEIEALRDMVPHPGYYFGVDDDSKTDPA